MRPKSQATFHADAALTASEGTQRPSLYMIAAFTHAVAPPRGARIVEQPQRTDGIRIYPLPSEVHDAQLEAALGVT